MRVSAGTGEYVAYDAPFLKECTEDVFVNALCPKRGGGKKHCHVIFDDAVHIERNADLADQRPHVAKSRIDSTL